MKLKELTHFLEAHAPLQYQESYDNSGLIIGDPESEVQGALICLDVTLEVLDEASALGLNLVISHHPMIFSGVKTLTGANYTQQMIREAIIRDIHIYAIHTNLDNVLIDGVNTRIGRQLGLLDIQALRPGLQLAGAPPKGIGITGRLPEPMSADAFLAYLKERMQTGCIRYTQPTHEPISTVAVCGGSGSFLLQDAVTAGAQVFVSGDFKYHDFFDGPGKIMIADIGHFESEQFTVDLLYELISAEFRNFAVRKTSVVTNPVKYF